MEHTFWWAGAGGMLRHTYSVGKSFARAQSNPMVRSGPPYAVDQRQVRSGGWLPDNLCSQEMRSERRILMNTRTRVCGLCVRFVPPIALTFAVGMVSALLAHEALPAELLL